MNQLFTLATNRRSFLQSSAAALATGALSSAFAQERGARPTRANGVTVLNPRERVPLSFIIDDSTCLVNLNRFAMPQFAQAFPEAKVYQRDWKSWPVEIPDDFVRKFGNWCGEHGVKGKYSIVPFPACVGRLDRVLPGWTAKELTASVDLVRKEMTPSWDIHPEMITHTRVIDLKTGHPYADPTERFMENWRWTDGKSVDELTQYLAYALKILKNIDLPCEGVTTPGGFGNRVLPQLAQATFASVRDVYKAEIPHYFRHLYDRGDESVAPRVEYARDLDTDDPKCVVSIIGCTGDWTGGWDNSDELFPDRFITPDLKSGRLVEVIERDEPAILVCHWTGIHYNGEERGFKVFQEVVKRLESRFELTRWMKLSEIARYWAAKELTTIEKTEQGVRLKAPFASPDFTLRIDSIPAGAPSLKSPEKLTSLREVKSAKDLATGTWRREGADIITCFDLPKGNSELIWTS
jgi:hypothetical protein